METIDYREQIPVRPTCYDVVVSGGGVAGVAAALTAARSGKQTLLIEKSNILGGLGTLGQVNLFVPMCNGRGTQIIFGLCEELAQLSRKYGWAQVPREWANGQPAEPTNVRYCVRYSPVCFAMAMLKFLENSGVNLLLDTIVSAPVMDGRHCRGVIIEGKSGREFIRGKMFIDVTGDGDLMRRAGMQVVVGENFETYMAKAITLESCRQAVESGDIGRAFELSFGGPADLYGHQQPAEIPLWHGTSTDETTAYLLRNQKCLLKKYENTPVNSYELLIPLMPQSRTSCRIAGEYVLRVEDAYRHFDDSVAAICDFDRRDYLYEVPYRTLFQKGYDNIATAGRCAAGTGYGWDVLRVIPPAIITGQAIGNAACLALDTGCGFDSIAVQELQKRQEAQNVRIHFDDALVPDDSVATGEYAPAFGHV